MRRRASGLALALAFATVAAAAQTVTKPPVAPAPASKKAQSELRMPKGPIKITAERADLERKEMALYRGNVRLTSDELELQGDRLELRQPAKGQFTAVLTGRPARLRHKGVADAPAMAATAGRIVYDTRTAVVEMSEGARLERGGDTVSSERITYNVTARRISASAAQGSQVQITIEPPAELQEKRPAVPQNTPRP
jgi:lipopolysaccharide export system protein LptA